MQRYGGSPRISGENIWQKTLRDQNFKHSVSTLSKYEVTVVVLVCMVQCGCDLQFQITTVRKWIFWGVVHFKSLVVHFMLWFKDFATNGTGIGGCFFVASFCLKMQCLQMLLLVGRALKGCAAFPPHSVMQLKETLKNTHQSETFSFTWHLSMSISWSGFLTVLGFISSIFDCWR